MKTFEQTKEWYISAVKATLVLNFSVSESEAEKAIENYGLKKRIEADPEGELANSIDGVAEEVARTEFVGRPNQLTYKGFFTEVRYDSRLRHLYGRVYGIDDFVTFEASSISTVESVFRKAVDDYLEHAESCEESVPELEAASRIIEEDSRVVRPALQDSVMVAPAARMQALGGREDFARFIDSMSDEEFLRSMGIEPEKEAAEAYREEQVSKEEARKAIDEMTDPAFLKSMGIDPDEVML